MATLQELRGLFADSDIHEKVEAAMIIAVQAILDGTPSTDDQKYAAQVFSNPKGEANKAVMSVLAKNSTFTVAQILAAPDTVAGSIQSNVDAVVPTLSAAYIASLPVSAP